MPQRLLHIPAVDRKENRDGCASMECSLKQTTAQRRTPLHPRPWRSRDSPLMQVFAKGENHKYIRPKKFKVSVVNGKNILNTLFLILADIHVKSSVS